jgi:hypothetical protein
MNAGRHVVSIKIGKAMSVARSKFLFGSVAAVFIATLTCAQAAAPKVTAVLRSSSAIVGEMVEMQIRISGGGEAAVPRDISIDGLEIHQTGTSRQVEMQNFDISQSVTYSYSILPTKSGTFRIPPQTVKVGGSSFQTPELELTVAADNAPNQGNQNGRNPAAQTVNAKLAFSDITVTKPAAYVGEAIPVEVRIGFNSRVPHQLLNEPEIGGQGFTIQKLQSSGRSRMEAINGANYEVITFKTAIAATRTGKLEIGPAQAPAAVVVPRQRGSGRQLQSPFDRFNLDDLFNDPFSADPYTAFGEQRKIAVKSDPAALEAKPLPSNAPASFSGAIGNFSLHLEANPKNVQVGDPITVTATISGRGNFDRVNAPVLPDTKGWHSYPPSSKFKQDDDVGISGTKTFEIVLSPNDRKDAVPPLEFAYFDPLSEKYVSLKSSPIPIHVEGEALPATSSAAAAASSAPAPSVAPSAAPQLTAKPGEILAQLDDRRQSPASFSPVFLKKEFWLAQLLALAVLVAYLIWKIGGARRRNLHAVRTAALQREVDALRRKLRRSDLRPADFYADASRAIQIKSALLSGSDPERIDAAAATKVLGVDESGQEQISTIFEHRDELRYSGSANGFDSLPEDERKRLVKFVEELR